MYYAETRYAFDTRNITGISFSCQYGCTDNESRWYQQGVRASFERIVLVTSYQTKLNGEGYYTHNFYITNIMEQQGKLYRQVWGKVTEEILSQYRTTAQNLNYARRLGMW